MDYLFDYLMFLAQAVTVVIAILIVVSMVQRQDASAG